jgi:uncharacterized protein YdaU (DUF1376 family)
VNYFEFHIGDYAEATSHLSLLQHGVYMRLIQKYYSLERPLAKKIEDLALLIGVKFRAERIALNRVLEQFFELKEDGWHQRRCDEVIAEYRDGEPERQAKRDNEKVRKRRYRERRMELFEQLRAYGEAPSWDAKIVDLERLLERHQGRTGNGAGTRSRSDLGRGTGRGQDAPGTATHLPVPSPHLPVPNPSNPLPPLQKGVSRQRRSEFRAEQDEARVIWSELLASDGARPKRDERVQAALDAVGGYQAMRLRREGDEAQMRRRFVDAYLAHEPLNGRGTEGGDAQH